MLFHLCLPEEEERGRSKAELPVDIVHTGRYRRKGLFRPTTHACCFIYIRTAETEQQLTLGPGLLNWVTELQLVPGGVS